MSTHEEQTRALDEYMREMTDPTYSSRLGPDVVCCGDEEPCEDGCDYHGYPDERVQEVAA